MKKVRKILGIDPGFGRVGLGLVLRDGQKMQFLDAHTIETDPGLQFYERLNDIQKTLEKYIDKHQPDAAVIEQLYFTKNVTTALKVAEACGVIGLVLCQKGIHIYKLTPTQMKMALTANGKSSKKEVQIMVERILKDVPSLTGVLDDAIDALAMAMAI